MPTGGLGSGWRALQGLSIVTKKVRLGKLCNRKLNPTFGWGLEWNSIWCYSIYLGHIMDNPFKGIGQIWKIQVIWISCQYLVRVRPDLFIMLKKRSNSQTTIILLIKIQQLTFYIILDLKDLSPIKITPSNNNPDFFSSRTQRLSIPRYSRITGGLYWVKTINNQHPSIIRCQSLNSRPLDYEPSASTTRPHQQSGCLQMWVCCSHDLLAFRQRRTAPLKVKMALVSQPA